MNKISLIIPHMPFPESDVALEKCLKSFEGEYDELILVVNVALGYGWAVNQGLKWASGDILIVSNNDIELVEGSLKTMGWTPSLTVPRITPTPRDNKPRCIFAMPRWIYEETIKLDGYFYDPRFKFGFWEDDDLIRRLDNRGIITILDESVLVHHLNGGGLTMKRIGEQKWFDINKKEFELKYKDTYS